MRSAVNSRRDRRRVLTDLSPFCPIVSENLLLAMDWDDSALVEAWDQVCSALNPCRPPRTPDLAGAAAAARLCDYPALSPSS